MKFIWIGLGGVGGLGLAVVVLDFLNKQGRKAPRSASSTEPYSAPPLYNRGDGSGPPTFFPSLDR